VPIGGFVAAAAHLLRIAPVANDAKATRVVKSLALKPR
jgi:hypothetical protein